MLSQVQLMRPALEPTDDSTLNVVSHVSESSSKKRKSDVIDRESTQEVAFNAIYLPSKEQTVTFSAVALIARACLPLAWLNTSEVLPGPVFEASIPSVQEWEQRALVVRKLLNGGLYAVENVGGDNYVAVALHNWVTEEWCRNAAFGKITAAKIEDILKRDDGACRSHTRSLSGGGTPSLPGPKSPKKPTNRRGALARMSILTPRDMAGQREATPRTPDSPGLNNPAAAAEPSPTTPPLPVTPAAHIKEENSFDAGSVPTGEAVEIVQEAVPKPEQAMAAEDQCAPERLRDQYFEHLYSSKTSLAFYVKGPLSRARAHVRSTTISPSKAIAELAAFYEESILAAKKIDLKYKETLSTVIKGLDSELESQESRRKRQKKRKPMKLGKDGLWPDEEEFIAKWWRGRELKPAITTEHQPDEIRKEMSELRMRETKMQMLLILEVMLLDIAVSRLSEIPKVPTDPDVKVESIEEDPSAILAQTARKQEKPKKKRDLAGELDTIVDRLCIWHTVSQDELNTGSNPDSLTDNSSATTKGSDSLRDFCKDVLLPFYSAKLPEQIKSISRKLGGPELSPKRPAKRVPQQTTGAAQPGAAPPPPPRLSSRSSSSLLGQKSGRGQGQNSSHQQPRTKRTLERVLSEDQAHRHASPPTTLSRSSTAPLGLNAMVPTMATLKREQSERPLSRGGMGLGLLAKSASFSNREIDLDADSRTHEAKRRKLDRLAQQKRELEAAIEALRRPSRTTVAGEFMDEVEKRGGDKSTKTVQITATPRARRFGDYVARGKSQGHHHHQDHGFSTEPELPPMMTTRTTLPTQHGRPGQDDDLVVPSSTTKAQLGSLSSLSHDGMPASVARPNTSTSTTSSRQMIPPPAARGSSATKRAVLSAIHETPTRGLQGKKSNPLGLADRDCDAAAATHSSTTAMTTTSTTSITQNTAAMETSSGSGSRSRRTPILFTGLKKSDVSIEHAFRDAPEIPERAGRLMDRVMGGKARGDLPPASFGIDVDIDTETWAPTGLGQEKPEQAGNGTTTSFSSSSSSVALEQRNEESDPNPEPEPPSPSASLSAPPQNPNPGHTGNRGGAGHAGGAVAPVDDGNDGEDGDIYAKLGWDDDDDFDI
ncbi:hypothetical protein HRR83_009486 [Exophiala dermatitidis]|uniref:DNA replication regulator SLD3 n=2 Tax=Exophiala dermatitidis TaxID=5970 RepID=H6BTU2_EXODN|nr:DNA replication regulator SLD3 [Exophiala dermatitidis NIH/UT8656]KAJ4501958.1 hypothetical protein HRR75_008792 [Exophiala dermatitidis]EHY55519.1 DNA replication regulator SLD3 [Exophiala dermatitidis NIH/UT8656]KAJ4502589.1 hypothetical protein HRR74_009554 [Exophiala dermatitidis]KAJ4510288.1 hypothetical protein HRR73_007086 [Exophiala dermatitidis]KAJ4531490.1 hypothetical protein HRR77_009422 [Exophiala dermatitidis]